MPENAKISEKTIERLSIYRRYLSDQQTKGVTNIFSHQLAVGVGTTAAQVRQDLTVLGFTGTPSKGYDINGLNQSLKDFLDTPEGTNVALIGVGNLGRALLAYFSVQRAALKITAAFDVDLRRTNRLIGGVPAYHMKDIGGVIREQGITVAIIAVPEMEAQKVADIAIEAGVKGILNFAPVALRVPGDVFVENMDMTMAMEKVAYYAQQPK